MKFTKNNVEVNKEGYDYYINVVWDDKSHILALTEQEILDIKSLINKVLKDENN